MGKENYSFKKRQRELATKKKQEEKMRQKLEKRNEQANTEANPASGEDETTAQQN